jgi:hypothetical protein
MLNMLIDAKATQTPRMWMDCTVGTIYGVAAQYTLSGVLSSHLQKCSIIAPVPWKYRSR